MLIGFGVGLVAGAVAWWAGFYGWLANELGGSLSEVVPCLLVSDDTCALLAGVGGLTGRPVYSPVALWAGIAVLAIGIVLHLRRGAP
ncbi:hypothetical protein sos41_00710 [Alphaproteobacteria bacterium SO-S41]|nr:hypothetical protein sos41_00710 [Alphaproteobacteria bacterium SO-S41]